MVNDTPLLQESVSFIYNWVMSDGSEKTKAYYDVWDIVLKTYLPQMTAFSEFVIKFVFSKVIRRFPLPNYIGTYTRHGIRGFRFLSMCNSRNLIFRDFRSSNNCSSQKSLLHLPLQGTGVNHETVGGYSFGSFVLHHFPRAQLLSPQL